MVWRGVLDCVNVLLMKFCLWLVIRVCVKKGLMNIGGGRGDV